MPDRVLRYGSLAGLLLLFVAPEAAAGLTASWWGFPPLLLLFLCLAASLLGWGYRLSARFGSGLAGALLGASLFAVLFPMILSPLHLLSVRPVFFLALAPGAFLLPSLRTHAAPPGFPRWAFALFGFAAFVRVLSAFLPQAHGDPLLYHLVGPRLWEMAGTARLEPDLPNAILASSWEYFYLWPQAIFADTRSLSQLVAAQVFCQWIHLAWGWLGIAIVIERVARSLPLEARWRFLLPLAALFPASLQWTAGLAKNDAGIAFWCLGFWLAADEARRSRLPSLWGAAGLLAGLAVTGKINAVLFLGPAGLVILGLALREGAFPGASGMLLLVGGVLAGAVPVYLRNWAQTGSPVFPMFPHLFPSPWNSQTWIDHFSSVHPGESMNRVGILLVRVKELWKETPLTAGWLLLPVALILPASRARMRPAFPLLLVGGISAGGFLFAFSLDAELRYLGASLVVLAVAGLLTLLALAELLPPRARRATPWLLLLVVLASSKLPTHLLWKLGRISTGEKFLLTHTAGDAKAWLRENAPETGLTVMMGDNETYYLLGKRVTTVTERPDLDRATRGLKSLKDFVGAVCSLSGATYLLDSRPQIGLAHLFPGADLTGALAFEGVSSRVVDLRRLEARLSPGGGGACGRTPAPVYALSPPGSSAR